MPAAIDWPSSGKSQYKGLLTGYTHEGIKPVESCKKCDEKNFTTEESVVGGQW
jgi:hypothetical protein